jgi:hypothetical protein
MSCSSCNPCYTAYYRPSANCVSAPCATVASQVIYNGPNLPGTGVQTGQNLDCALSEIDDAILQLKILVYSLTTTTTTTTATP